MSVGQFGIILLFVYPGLVRILSYVHTGCQMRGLIGQITLFWSKKKNLKTQAWFQNKYVQTHPAKSCSLCEQLH